MYCHLGNIELMDMDLYLNDDILFTYLSQIQHNPLFYEQLPLNNNILVKIDSKNGATIWAKEIFDYSFSVNFEINKSFLINDITWSLLFSLLSGMNTPGIITKVDIDGNLIEIFYIPFYVNESTASNYVFNVRDFYLFSDQSFITVASCSYSKGEFGVSEYSAIDFCFFKTDLNRNFEWSTSIDFLNRFEERETLFEYNNTLFVAIVTAKFYYCMLTLNKDTGVFNKWSCNYVYKPSTDSAYRILTISHVSERFIYCYANLFIDDSIFYFYSLLLFDSITLKLKLAYILNGCKKVYGFNIFELKSDAIYCAKNSKLYRILFNSTTNYDEVNLTFDYEIFNHNEIIFIMKEKSNKNYFISFVCHRATGEPLSFTYNDVMLLQLSYNFEINSCFSLNNLTKSNDFSSLIIGQNSTNNEKGIYYVDLTPNTFTTNASSIYSSSNNSTSYYFVDITRCVWPRPETQLTKCNYSLPSFNLLNSYNIHVGKKFTKNPVFIPFIHCQNASFIISARNTNASNDIQWLVIDQPNKSIIVDLTQIYSVGNFNISMSAKMITYFINNTYEGKYTTINYFSSFVFSNENCVFVSSNSSYYLVLNQLTSFLLTFNDIEEDLISVTIHQNDFINTFVKTISNTSNFIVMLQTNETSNDPTNLVISYTDYYHKDVSFMKQTMILLYLFAVDPPYFATGLQVVNANRCSNINVDLPAIADPNGLNCTISLDSSTPAWVSLNNRSLTLNTIDFRYNISETTIVSLKIINEKNAWVKYNLTIETDLYTSPSFGVISNITIVEGTQTEVKLELQSGLNVQVVDCTNNTITWIQFDKQDAIIIVNPSNNYMQIQCAKLLTLDSCQNKIYSNEFTIFVIKNVIPPPTLVNTFGPLIIYSGKTKLFIIPDDLFLSIQRSPLKYSVQVLKCSVNTLLNANVTISKYDNSTILYLQSNDPKTCFISLCAADSNGQIAEIEVEVKAQNCASKDCIECTSQYQDGCIKCITNYILGPSGICYLNTTSFSKSFENLFEICGLIILICLITNLILCFFIGIKSLYIIEFAHIFIIFVVSLSSQNTNLVKLISLIQIFKFDFGFIDYFNIRKLLLCKLGTDKMVNLNFYCQSTILNYSMLIIIVLILFCTIFLLKCASQRLKYVLMLFKLVASKINNQNIAWLLIHIFLPFLWINLISDAINSSSHLFMSLLSFMIFAILLILLLIKMPEVFTFAFIENIDKNSSVFLTLLTMLKSVSHALLFSLENQSMKITVLLAEFTLVITFIVSNIMKSKEKRLFELYFIKMLGVKHSFLLVILIVMSIDNIISIQISNSQTTALMMTSFFCFCTIVDLGSVVTLFFK